MIEIFHLRDSQSEDCLISAEVGIISKKNASKVLEGLCHGSLSLQRYGLGHLKRARRVDGDESILEVVLCPTNAIDLIPDELTSLISSRRTQMVVRVEPLTKLEHEQFSEIWPCYFRPSEQERIREKGCNEEDISRAVRYMSLVAIDEALFIQEDNDLGIGSRSGIGVGSGSSSSGSSSGAVDSIPVPGPGTRGGLVVNPSNGKVICTSFSAYQHLLKSSSSTATTSRSISSSNRGFDRAALARSPVHTAVMLLAYGVAEAGLGNLQCTDGPEARPHDPYLCTGLEVFLAQEPDLMSSMALVHSRVKTVIFRDLDAHNGALASHYLLHDLRTLNHRFRVFHLTVTATSANLNSNPPTIEQTIEQ